MHESDRPAQAAHDDDQKRQRDGDAGDAVQVRVPSAPEAVQLRDPGAHGRGAAAEAVHDALQDLAAGVCGGGCGCG